MIIGLNGLKGSGKDTVGSYLEDRYGFETKSFAYLLKESAAALFDIEPERWEEWKNNPDALVSISSPNTSQLGPSGNITRTSLTVREFLQRYGTESHRSIFGPDFWVEHAMKGVDPNKNIVFTDARFENELQRIKHFGGYNVQVLRPKLFVEDSHASEVPPPQHLIDYAIDNNKGFDYLYTQIDDFIQWLKVESRLTYEDSV